MKIIKKVTQITLSIEFNSIILNQQDEQYKVKVNNNVGSEMIINAVDESSLSQNTHRSFLLDKSIISHPNDNYPQKSQLYEIIRDKSICEDLSQDQDVKSVVSRFYEKFPMIRPENPYIVVWNIVVIMVIIFYIMEFPLILGYGQVVWKDLSTYFLPVLIVFYFILAVDILITPLKMVYKEGLLIKNRRILLKRYINTYLWVDVIGLFAIVLPLILKQYFAANLVKILFLPKVLVLNELDDKIVNVLIFQARLKTFYLIARLIVFMIMISHFIGIGFYMVSYFIYSTNFYGPNTPNICWLYNAQAYSQIILLLDWKGQYAYTMYFSLGMTTTIAYGDITPLNPMETLYIVFALVINVIAFGYILSEVLRILIEAFYAEFDMNNLKYTMENILVSRKVKPKLKQLIRAHMEQISTQQMYRDRKIERQVISSLPYNLQIGLYGQIYQEFIQSLRISPEPFYLDKNRNSRFIQKMVLQITEARYLVGDLIYKEHEMFTQEFDNHKAYFLKDTSNLTDIVLGVGKSPTVNIETHKIENQNDYMLFYHNRAFFGEVEFFTGGQRSHWVMSKNNILLYELPRNAFLKNLRYASRKELEYLTQLRETIAESYCYVCFGKHSFKKCHRTTFVPNVFEAVMRIGENEKMKRRHNMNIENVRSEKRITSAKTNALRIFKQSKTSKDKRALQKSKIRLLTSSKHYRKVYYEHDGEESSSCGTSSGSEEDLDNLINETKMLIEHLDEVGHNDNEKDEVPIFEYEFDMWYQFSGYKVKENWEVVLRKLGDLQKILKSKKRLSMAR